MFRECLQGILDRVGGMQSLALVGADGLPVDSVSRDGQVDLEMLSAEMVALVSSIGTNDAELGAGPLRQLLVQTSRQIFLTSRVTDGYYLLAVGSPQLEIGRARFELRRAPLELEAELL